MRRRPAMSDDGIDKEIKPDEPPGYDKRTLEETR
jgi:hypothetical protein